MTAQGHDVTYQDGDPGLFAQDFNLVCLSVIFSWLFVELGVLE